MLRVRIDSIWDWSDLPLTPNVVFHARTAKDEAGRAKKKCFQLVDF